MEEEENKYWKVVSWELRDLSKLETQLKTEFNANSANLGETLLLDSSVDPRAKRRKERQVELA
jgi:hypothetical protein